MITKIGNILKKRLPDFENIFEIIYTNHYLPREGYDEKNHTLMIRNCDYCYEGYSVDFELDTLKVIDILEKELPVKVEFVKQLMVEEGVTYKFFITLKEDGVE